MLQSVTGVLSFNSASRKEISSGKATRHQRRPQETRPLWNGIPWSRCVPELRLLENGREDRTPVRAVRAHPRVDSELSVNFCCHLPWWQQPWLPAVPHFVQWDGQNSKDVSSTRVFPDSDGALADYRCRLEHPLRWRRGLATFLLESLILAQDERWRRA